MVVEIEIAIEICIGINITTIRTLMCICLFIDIGLNVEIEEESKEHCPMKQNNITIIFGKITLNEKWKCGMDEEGSKLYKLHCCQISETNSM